MWLASILIVGSGLLLLNKLVTEEKPEVVVVPDNPIGKFPYRDLDEVKNHNEAMIDKYNSISYERGPNGIADVMLGTGYMKYKTRGANFALSDIKPTVS